jgi:hypothetical protein
MLALVEDDLGRFTLRKLRPWHGLLAGWRATRLDRALAGGTSPEASVWLAARAARLTSGRYRCDLAASLWRIAATAAPARIRQVHPLPLVRPIAGMLVRSPAARSAEDLAAVAEALATPGPVAARGVAMVNQLIADGSGPLYRAADADELAAVIRRAARALDAAPVTWSRPLSDCRAVRMTTARPGVVARRYRFQSCAAIDRLD